MNCLKTPQYHTVPCGRTPGSTYGLFSLEWSMIGVKCYVEITTEIYIWFMVNG